MIRDKYDWACEFNNITELKEWLNIKEINQAETLEEINDILLAVNDGIVTHWFEKF